MEIAIPVIGAVIQWILTTMLHIDKAFFIYGQEVRQYVVIVKVLYFFCTTRKDSRSAAFSLLE